MKSVEVVGPLVACSALNRVVLCCGALFSILLFGLSSPAEAERVRRNSVPVARCKEFARSIFKPCVCSQQVPRRIKYRPTLRECGGRSAAILFGEFANSFSVVLRDNQNRDRWPASGYNGCSAIETEAGLSKCSAFKCQDVLRVNSSSAGSGTQQICCFGERASSPLMRGATRLTIKLRDVPGAGTDPLLRICLNKFNPRLPLN